MASHLVVDHAGEYRWIDHDEFSRSLFPGRKKKGTKSNKSCHACTRQASRRKSIY